MPPSRTPSLALCGPEAAADVHRLTQLAFRDYDKLDPPSGAVTETQASVRADLQQSGGVLARLDQRVVGCLRFQRQTECLTVRRLAVDPAAQGQGIGSAMMRWTHDYARAQGFSEVRVGVRPQLVANLRFYQRLGYRIVAEHRHPGYDRTTWIEMGLAL